MVRWVIEGFDSTKLIFRAEMPKGLSVTEIAAVLRQLLARHLTDDEIIRSGLRRNMRGRASLLDARFERNTVSVGESPHFVVRRC